MRRRFNSQRQEKPATSSKGNSADQPYNVCLRYHFIFRAAFFFAKVPLPFAPRTACSSPNFFFAYRFASESSTSSSTIVRLRSARTRLSPLGVPKGVLVGMIVPILNEMRMQVQSATLPNTHREMLRQALDSLPFPFLLPVEPLGVECIPQPQRLNLAVQPG